MKFDINTYCKYIADHEFDKANEYKDSCLPSKLYKYFGLNSNFTCDYLNNLCCNDIRLNDIKFGTLENKKLWISKLKYFNDPFEFRSIYLGTNIIKSYDLSDLAKARALEEVNATYKYFENSYYITSFTTTAFDNMPMWAHYANNHQGFCIEYEILNNKHLYPVVYENKRVSAGLVPSILNITVKDMHGELTDEDLRNGKMFLYFMQLNAILKHKMWKYEDEYRILFNDYKYLDDSSAGRVIDLDELGLNIYSIYIGMKCSKQNRDKLIEIARHNNIRIYDMGIEEMDENYKLKDVEI